MRYKLLLLMIAAVSIVVLASGASASPDRTGDAGLHTQAAPYGKIYWTDFDGHQIQRANLDGSSMQDLVTTGLSRPTGIALNVAAGKMYWTDQGAGKIQRANLDGSGVQTLVSGLGGPWGIALAPATGVGGIAEAPDADASALGATAPGGSSSRPYAVIAGIAAGVALLGAGGWYARRRWRAG